MSNWRKDAACKDLPTEWWFDLHPKKQGKTGRPLWTEEMKRAIAICQECPVKDECLDWALQNEDYGIWGGTTPTQRKKLRAGTGMRLVAPEIAVTISPCGTPAGYAAHRRRGEVACQACREAHTNHRRITKMAR